MDTRSIAGAESESSFVSIERLPPAEMIDRLIAEAHRRFQSDAAG